MFSAQVEQRLARLSTGVRLVARELRVAGMGESDVDQRIAPIYTRHADVQTTILTAPGEIQVHLRAWSADAPAAERLLQQIQESIVLALGEAVFTTDGESMEEVVARELTLHQATIATAESCTGGLLAERLTRISGSSAYFLGGVVSYSNTLKSAWVDVPAEMIDIARRRQRGGRRRAGRRNSPAHRRDAWRGNHGRGRPHRRHARKARRHRARGDCGRVRQQGARHALSRASATASAGRPRRPRSIWCGGTSSTPRNPRTA